MAQIRRIALEFKNGWTAEFGGPGPRTVAGAWASNGNPDGLVELNAEVIGGVTHYRECSDDDLVEFLHQIKSKTA